MGCNQPRVDLTGETNLAYQDNHQLTVDLIQGLQSRDPVRQMKALQLLKKDASRKNFLRQYVQKLGETTTDSTLKREVADLLK